MPLQIEIQGQIKNVRKFERYGSVKYFANAVAFDDNTETVIPFVSDVFIAPSDSTVIKLRIGSYKKAEPFTDRQTGASRAALRDVVTFDLVH